MIQKIVNSPGTYRLHSFFSTCQQHSSYFDNKVKKQQEKQKLKYRNSSELMSIELNMKNLVPNFFAANLPFKYSKPILSDDKSVNYLANSFVHLDIPIVSKPELNLENALRKFNSPSVRIGRIMEVMDSIAGLVGYRHCYGSFDKNTVNPFILVTGCVDSINLFEPITTNSDIQMEGYINFAGTTSMEIQINLYQQNILKANTLFTMITRKVSQQNKGYPCPKLSFENLSHQEKQKAEKRFALASQNVVRRKKQMQQSYEKKPPHQKDIAILHDFFLKHKSSISRKSGCTIESTAVKNTLLMHLQERNVHSKIFGGFLMREMLETAWIAGNRFLDGSHFEIEDITNIYFTAPVQIGTQLRITAKAIYSKQNILVIGVSAQTYNSQTKQEILCCHLNVFIKASQKACMDLYPMTYENGILYLTGKNSFSELFHSDH